MRRRTYLSTGLAGLAGALAGCLGGDSENGPGEATTEPGTPADDGIATTEEPATTTTDGTETGTAAGGTSTVTVASSDQYGDYLADGEGMALYLFTNDEDGESACYDGCAQTWPPLIVEGAPRGGDGVTAQLGTTERRDGSMQAMAGDWPLYYYAPDESPGDTAGQGVGGVWFLLAPDGTAIEDAGGGTGTDGTTSGGGGGTTTDGGGGNDPYQY